MAITGCVHPELAGVTRSPVLVSCLFITRLHRTVKLGLLSSVEHYLLEFKGPSSKQRQPAYFSLTLSRGSGHRRIRLVDGWACG